MSLDEKSEVAESIVAFSLHTNRRIQVQLEPCGMIYDIGPGQVVEVRVIPPQEPPDVVVQDEGLLRVFCEGFAAVFIDGVDVDNRLPTKAEVAYFASDEYRELWERRRRAHEFMERLRAEQPEEWRRVTDIVQARVQAGDQFGENSKEAFAGVDEEIRIALRDAGFQPRLEID